DLSVVDGIAERGLIIRHLVLPGGMAGTEAVMAFIAEEISQDSYVNIMDQYRPMGNVFHHEKLPPEIRRPITEKEYREALRAARERGLHRGVT
ncbi:MAG: radical SAM protein, partial [Methanomicrobiaceae archaeon]|nr:radical SAM protein [Methanomicrobiaceae archaeon]